CLQLLPLARAAWERRHYVLVERTDSWTGGHYQARGSRGHEEPRPFEAPTDAGVPLANPQQLALGVAGCVAGLAAFFPQVVDASEASIRYHHLDHAGHFFLGVMLGLVLGSLPALSRRLGE